MGQKLRGWGKISKNPPRKKVFRRKKSYSYRKRIFNQGGY